MLWGGYLWWNSKSEVIELIPVQQEPVIEVPQVQPRIEEEVPEEEEERVVEEDPEASPPLPDVVLTEEEKFNTEAHDWAKQVRDFIDGMDILFMTGGGKAMEQFLGEGAEAPDLHAIKEEIIALADLLDVPSACEEALPIMKSITEQIEKMTEPLSHPPTAEELRSVIPQQKTLMDTLNKYYGVANSYCQ